MSREKFFAACRTHTSLVLNPGGVWVQALMADTRRIGLFISFTSLGGAALVVPNTGAAPTFTPTGLGLENFTTAIWGWQKDGPIMMSEWWFWSDAASATCLSELILNYDPCGTAQEEGETTSTWVTDIPKQQGMGTPIGDTPPPPDITRIPVATQSLSMRRPAPPVQTPLQAAQTMLAQQAADRAVAQMTQLAKQGAPITQQTFTPFTAPMPITDRLLDTTVPPLTTDLINKFNAGVPLTVGERQAIHDAYIAGLNKGK